MKYGLLKKDKNGVSELYSLSDYIIEDENGNAKKLEMMQHTIKIT